ncbi:MAG: YkgJ family cysteine cluster protein [Deltaproteobacteria bacterium]|nr:YkgJ family cysteine cluster protein [Deltaproteobacteria bacterium]
MLPIHGLVTPAAQAGLAEAEAGLVAAVSAAEGHIPGAAPNDAVIAGYARFLAGYDDFLTAIGAYLPLRCGAGCGACCRDNPRGVTGVELWWLRRSVDADPDGPRRLAAAKVLAARWSRVLASTGGDAALAQRLAAQDGLPCPLLDEAERCAHYAARPIACRAFVAFTEPALCDPRHPEHHEAVQPQLEPGPDLRALLVELSARLGLGGLPDDLRSGLGAVGKL